MDSDTMRRPRQRCIRITAGDIAFDQYIFGPALMHLAGIRRRCDIRRQHRHMRLPADGKVIFVKTINNRRHANNGGDRFPPVTCRRFGKNRLVGKWRNDTKCIATRDIGDIKHRNNARLLCQKS